MAKAVFNGFSDGTFAFLKDLKAHNDKAWFDANRDRYEAIWKGEAQDLIAALSGPMSELDPPLQAVPRLNGSLRRINRDVRFSKDKSPYSARLHLIFWTGEHPNRSPGMHLVLHPDGIGYGAGAWGYDPAALKRLRKRILDPKDRAALMAAIEQARAAGSEMGEPDLVNLPKGYEEAKGDWTHLLRRKAFVMRTLERVERPDWISSPDATARIMDLTRAHLPFIRWLAS
jgi:uncharacterized protein (TIGR02453 family)